MMAAMSGAVTTTPEEPREPAGWGAHRPRHPVISARECQWCWATGPPALSPTIGGTEPHDRVVIKA